MKTTNKVAPILMTLLMLGMAATATDALAKKQKYKAGKVDGGGSISGVVTLKGDAPAPIMEDLNKGKNVEFCMTHPDTKEGGLRPAPKFPLLAVSCKARWSSLKRSLKVKPGNTKARILISRPAIFFRRLP